MPLPVKTPSFSTKPGVFCIFWDIFKAPKIKLSVICPLRLFFDGIQEIVHHFCRCSCCTLNCVGVYLRCGVRCAVAQSSCYGSDRHTVGNLQGGIGMPQAVNMDLREICCFDEAAEPTGQGVRMHGRSILGNKYLSFFLPRLTDTQEQLSLPCAVYLQGSKRGCGSFDCPATGSGFGFRFINAFFREILQRSFNGDQVVFKINVTPAQSHQLAPAHSSEQQDRDRSSVIDRLILYQLQEPNRLFIIQVYRLIAFCLGRLYPFRYIGRNILPLHSGLENHGNQTVICT